ncbi:MAG: hypothetical protein AAB320_00115 [Elusimicrobiota bacterium]
MKGKLFYALLASTVVVGASMAMSAAVLNWIPKGKTRDFAEKTLIAPGEMLYERLDGKRKLKQLRKAGEKELEKLEDSKLGAAAIDTVDKLERLPHYYNVGAWALTGFVLCFLMTLFFGVSSFKSALALGLKVTVTLIFLQGALVFAGVLAYQNLAR